MTPFWGTLMAPIDVFTVNCVVVRARDLHTTEQWSMVPSVTCSRGIIVSNEIEASSSDRVSKFGSVDECRSCVISPVGDEICTKQVTRNSEKEALKPHLIHFCCGNPVFVDTSSVIIRRVYSGFQRLTPVCSTKNHCREADQRQINT